MAEGELIAEANVGTIPYMAMWVLFLCALLSTLCHPAGGVIRLWRANGHAGL
jgi:hypothetical protein